MPSGWSYLNAHEMSSLCFFWTRWCLGVQIYEGSQESQNFLFCMASKCSWTQAPVTSQETRQLEGHFISHLQCKIEEGSHKQMLLPAAKAHKSVIFTWFLAIFWASLDDLVWPAAFFLLFRRFLRGDSWTLIDHFLCLGISGIWGWGNWGCWESVLWCNMLGI